MSLKESQQQVPWERHTHGPQGGRPWRMRGWFSRRMEVVAEFEDVSHKGGLRLCSLQLAGNGRARLVPVNAGASCDKRGHWGGQEGHEPGRLQG